MTGVAEGFGAVADAFRRNFVDPGEDAAAVAVFHRGRKVVGLWAGTDVVNQTLIESGTAGPDIRFGLGFQLASPSMPGFGASSFGHTGAGGRLGIADPEHRIGFGYVCSVMRTIGPTGDPRWRTLIEAVRRCV